VFEQALRKHAEPTRELQTLDTVLASVGSFFGVSRSQLAARTRSERLRLPRQLAMYLCRRYTDASLSEIGRVFGRNHPAVANAIQRVERAILERAPLRYQVEELAARLEGRSNERRLTPKAPPAEREPAPDPPPRGNDEAR